MKRIPAGAGRLASIGGLILVCATLHPDVGVASDASEDASACEALFQERDAAVDTLLSPTYLTSLQLQAAKVRTLVDAKYKALEAKGLGSGDVYVEATCWLSVGGAPNDLAKALQAIQARPVNPDFDGFSEKVVKALRGVVSERGSCGEQSSQVLKVLTDPVVAPVTAYLAAADGLEAQRCRAATPPAAVFASAGTQDLGGLNPADAGRYELPGRVSVAIPENGTSTADGDHVTFTLGPQESVVFYPVPIKQMGKKMLEVGHRMDGVYEFRKMEVTRRLGEIDVELFDSETRRLGGAYSGARLILIEACCGRGLVGMAIAVASSPDTLWSNVDQLFGSLRHSTLAVDPRCADSAGQMRSSMTTLTSSAYGEAFRRRLVIAAGSLKAELARRVGTDGPSEGDQNWADCAVDAVTAADDVVRGVWQMNAGGYAGDWLAAGRFSYEQEHMLERIARPGDVCATWVRTQFGGDSLMPADQYLEARAKLDEFSCPTGWAGGGVAPIGDSPTKK